MRNATRAIVLSSCALAFAGQANAEGFWSGNWYLTLGGSGISAPKFEGAKDNKLFFSPIISLGRGNQPRFSSRNDSASFAIYDTDVLRAGVAGKFIPGRDAGDADELIGLANVRNVIDRSHDFVEQRGLLLIPHVDQLDPRKLEPTLKQKMSDEVLPCGA